MRWEELTSDQFPEAVKKAEGVCLLPLSCVERHGHHLPLKVKDSHKVTINDSRRQHL